MDFLKQAPEVRGVGEAQDQEQQIFTATGIP